MARLITQQGLEELQLEFNKIQEVDLVEINLAIDAAKKEGDLSENAGYDAALKARADLLTRMDYIADILSDYEIIENSGDSTIVSVGANIKLQYTTTKAAYELKIVGSSEVDVFSNPQKISNESPLAIAVLGKKVGTKVEVKAPSGVFSVEILEISKD
jgi:transcription elongation factor GreA